jgi:hypothetical protein
VVCAAARSGVTVIPHTGSFTVVPAGVVMTDLLSRPHDTDARAAEALCARFELDELSFDLSNAPFGNRAHARPVLWLRRTESQQLLDFIQRESQMLTPAYPAASLIHIPQRKPST